MSSAVAPLHQILKDKTRRRILLSLNDKEHLSYSDLMNNLGIEHTGSMNYHIRMLGDLLSKNDAGQYILSDKGKIAIRMLLEFPEDTGQLYKEWIKVNLFSKKPNYLLYGEIFWIIALIALIFLAALKAINLQTFIFPWLFFVTGLFYIIRHIRSSKRERLVVHAKENSHEK